MKKTKMKEMVLENCSLEKASESVCNVIGNQNYNWIVEIEKKTTENVVLKVIENKNDKKEIAMFCLTKKENNVVVEFTRNSIFTRISGVDVLMC